MFIRALVAILMVSAPSFAQAQQAACEDPQSFTLEPADIIPTPESETDIPADALFTVATSNHTLELVICNAESDAPTLSRIDVYAGSKKPIVSKDGSSAKIVTNLADALFQSPDTKLEIEMPIRQSYTIFIRSFTQGETLYVAFTEGYRNKEQPPYLPHPWVFGRLVPGKAQPLTGNCRLAGENFSISNFQIGTANIEAFTCSRRTGVSGYSHYYTRVKIEDPKLADFGMPTSITLEQPDSEIGSFIYKNSHHNYNDEGFFEIKSAVTYSWHRNMTSGQSLLKKAVYADGTTTQTACDIEMGCRDL